MNPAPILELVLSSLSLPVTVALIVRLLKERLHRIYSSFFAYLIFECVLLLAFFIMRGLGLTSDTNEYALLYVLSQPLEWVFYFIVIREVYTIVLRDHPGIAAAGKFFLTAGFLAALALALFTVGPELQHMAQLEGQFSSPDFNKFLLATRVILTALLFFLIAIVGFLVWFPVSITRNAAYYCFGFAVLFSVKAITLLFRNMSQSQVQWLSILMLTMANSCYLMWILNLNGNTGEAKASISQALRKLDSEQLLKQLDSINNTLERIGRR